jgi:NTP pyrophosphatase (non-canonical NTP hydrolase)
MNTNPLEEITAAIVKFRDQRNWKQYHNPKDLALSLVLESAEVMEHFQWKSKEEMDAHVKTHKKEISAELADVFYWVMLMCHDLNIDIVKASKLKMKENAKKYPVAKAKGKHDKYTSL